MTTGRAQSERQPLGARIRGLRLSTKIVLLVVCAALGPALLVGVASYITVQRIQAEEVTRRLSDQVAGTERQVSRFVEQRWVATRAIAGAKVLGESLAAWERARHTADAENGTLARSRIDRYLATARLHDAGYEGLAVFDADGKLVSATPSTELWARTEAATPPSTGEGQIEGTGAAALVHMYREVRGEHGRSLGRLLTVSRLESLWNGFGAAYEETPLRLRIVDGRRQTLFDSDSHPHAPEADLPTTVSDQLLDLLVGQASYADEAGVEVVASHRFIPSLDLGVLVEIPAAAAALTSRRWREFAVSGSLATVALFAIICSVLALQLTRPFRALVRGVAEIDIRDLLHRLPVSSTDEVGSLTVAVNQMLDALDKSSRQLDRLSSTDELTGLYNRRHLDAMFDVELNRASRSGRPLSVLMIDLDHFKAFNDTFGRPQGDAFLRHVGSFLRIWLRATDVLARYGGEEFAALLPDTDRKTAVEIAERLRTQFADSHPAHTGDDKSITLSVGVATWTGGSTIQADLIEAADRAVVEAKQNGRNQVRFAA